MSKQVRYVVEHVVEVRHLPFMGFLDKRATIGELLSEKLRFPNFEISMDRFDLWNEQKNIQVFVSHKNYGMAAFCPATESLFVETLKHVTQSLKDISDIIKFKDLIRHGVKSTFLFPWDKSFDDLRLRIEKGYGNLTPEALKCFDGRVSDIGFNWNFSSKQHSMKTQCGPMLKEQALQYFNPTIMNKLSEIGLFFLIDTYNTSEHSHDLDRIVDSTGSWLAQQIQVFENLVQLIRS